MRRNQSNVHAKDFPLDSGVTNSASLRPGEKSAMSGAGVCGPSGTAMSRARKTSRQAQSRKEKESEELVLRHQCRF